MSAVVVSLKATVSISETFHLNDGASGVIISQVEVARISVVVNEIGDLLSLGMHYFSLFG